MWLQDAIVSSSILGILISILVGSLGHIECTLQVGMVTSPMALVGSHHHLAADGMMMLMPDSFMW